MEIKVYYNKNNEPMFDINLNYYVVMVAYNKLIKTKRKVKTINITNKEIEEYKKLNKERG